jgi:hypothetical protein
MGAPGFAPEVDLECLARTRRHQPRRARGKEGWRLQRGCRTDLSAWRCLGDSGGQANYGNLSVLGGTIRTGLGHTAPSAWSGRRRWQGGFRLLAVAFVAADGHMSQQVWICRSDDVFVAREGGMAATNQVSGGVGVRGASRDSSQ